MTEEVVKVLYDYSYSDDRGEVKIKKNEVYRLIEKTNDEWWQVYDPADEDGESFFVPAQYIEIVSDVSPWKTLSDFDKALLVEGTRNSPTPDYNSDEAEEHPSTKGPKISVGRPESSASNDDPEGDYVNLGAYRDTSGISQPTAAQDRGNKENVKSASDRPNVPIELIKGTMPPPFPEEGTFLEVLSKGLPWDVYQEHVAGRRYYVNRNTGERMWKPPRKEKALTPTSETSPSLSPFSPKQDVGVSEDFEKVQDNGNLYFIPKSGKEKQRDVAWEPQGPRLSTFGSQSIRASKTMSTFGQLEVPSSGGGLSKAATLPAKFSASYENIHDWNAPNTSPPPIPLEPPPSHTSQSRTLPPKSPSTLPPVSEVFGTYLNRKKIADTGKKKVKKSWGQQYVVLQGSNLIFYKDEKAAYNTPGTPHGIPEGVVSLQGAQIDFNPSKDISGTSKKNIILLSANSGIAFLFQSDNEKTIKEWLTKMKLVAKDTFETGPRNFDFRDDRKEDKKSLSRSTSAVEDSHFDKKVASSTSIKTKLFNFFSLRPTQEDLIKRGIIKDSVFGSRLNELCDKEKSNVPNFVKSCIQAVENKDLTHDGMYRISGNMAEIQRLRYAVDKDDKCNLFDEQWDVHVLTGSLKLFFRELKEPVFPFHLYNRFVDAIQKESKKEKLSNFKSAVSSLPRCNYYTLKELFRHLRKVVELSHMNRMESQNVAIVFGPTLLWQENDSGSLALHTVFQSKIVEFILIEYSELFK